METQDAFTIRKWRSVSSKALNQKGSINQISLPVDLIVGVGLKTSRYQKLTLCWTVVFRLGKPKVFKCLDFARDDLSWSSVTSNRWIRCVFDVCRIRNVLWEKRSQEQVMNGSKAFVLSDEQLDITQRPSGGKEIVNAWYIYKSAST